MRVNKSGKIFKRVYVTENGQIVHRIQQLHSLLLHLRAADSGDLQIRIARAYPLDDPGGEQITGRLTRHHRQDQAHPRLTPREAVSKKLTNGSSTLAVSG